MPLTFFMHCLAPLGFGQPLDDNNTYFLSSVSQFIMPCLDWHVKSVAVLILYSCSYSYSYR